MKYVTVEKQFHKLNAAQFNEWFNKRIESDTTIKFDFEINGSKAFFCYEIPLFNLLLEIQEKNNKLNSIFDSLPKIASSQYIRNSLVIDVKKTNEIEGVFSSKKEIFELTEDLKKRQSNKIGSIVNKYLMLLDGKAEKRILKCSDIRKIYDDMFLSGNQTLIDPDKKPDGMLFRKDFVGVFDGFSGEPIHKGITPEDKIIFYLEKALEILNNTNLNKFIRIALFHYIFEYVHPFYDGNGRIGRYIISLFVKNEISEIFAFRISAGINAYKEQYYKAFADTEKVLNKADLTLFVYEFLDILDKTYDDCLKYAQSKKDDLEKRYEEFKTSLPNISKNEDRILYVLVQATLFSDFGITTKEIQKTLGISTRTIRRVIDEFKCKKLLLEQRYSRFIFYKLN